MSASEHDDVIALGDMLRQLRATDAFTAATDTLTGEGSDWDQDEVSGVLELCHQGCAIYSHLVAEVGGDWRARPAFGRLVHYFEADDIPAQLELDERDRVIKVSPWRFI